jgi:hypothetical protein
MILSVPHCFYYLCYIVLGGKLTGIEKDGGAQEQRSSYERFPGMISADCEDDVNYRAPWIATTASL